MNGGCINGTGVTFSGTNKYQPVSINGSVRGALYAPTNGPTRAMLFFQDRAFSGGQANVVNGSTGLTLQGTTRLYVARHSPVTALIVEQGR
jgi:hypothetical protein